MPHASIPLLIQHYITLLASLIVDKLEMFSYARNDIQRPKKAIHRQQVSCFHSLTPVRIASSCTGWRTVCEPSTNTSMGWSPKRICNRATSCRALRSHCDIGLSDWTSKSMSPPRAELSTLEPNNVTLASGPNISFTATRIIFCVLLDRRIDAIISMVLNGVIYIFMCHLISKSTDTHPFIWKRGMSRMALT